MNLLAPGGALAATVPYYEDRPQQRQMAAAVARSLQDGRPLMVEAGTGTGKTLAYLIPALQSGKRVVVSTGTRALQDQISRQDIPLLRTILARPFSVVVLKGVSNYACRRRIAEAATKLDGNPQLADLVDWSEHSETGDRSEVEWLSEDAPLWAEVTTTPEARLGPRCPHFERCFVVQARRRAEKAELILVNHHLYFADLALRAEFPGARVVPDHDAVIFDEAHQLEDVATEHFGASVSTHKLAALVRDAHTALARMPLWTGRAAVETIRSVERSGAALFALVRRCIFRAPLDEPRVPLPQGLFERSDLQDAWFRLDTALEDLARIAEAEVEPPPTSLGNLQDVEARASLAGVVRRTRALRDNLATIAEQRHKSHVYWGDARGASTAITASPIDIAELMRRHIVSARPTAIFTSATLATAPVSREASATRPPIALAATDDGEPLRAARDFSYHRARFGLDDAVDELIVASPFDYARQAMLYVPRDLPAPHHDGFADAAASRTLELLAMTNGRAFLLFTSHRALRYAAERLATAPYPKLVQGDAPRATLVDRFRATPGAILLGTASFWEGVDVPGDALCLVVIDKLPFAVHTDPLVAARMTALAELGHDPFSALQLPQAALALKQGFGRLIRRSDDRGIVAILDQRIVTKAYGRVFLDTLPAGLPRTSTLERVRRWWASPDGKTTKSPDSA